MGFQKGATSCLAFREWPFLPYFAHDNCQLLGLKNHEQSKAKQEHKQDKSLKA